jgi:hypothetical protein
MFDSWSCDHWGRSSVRQSACFASRKPWVRVPPSPRYNVPMSEEQRFWSKVEKSESCWTWTASQTRGGYGQFYKDGGIPILAHRWSYQSVNGPIPDGLVMDHLCRVRNCVRPDHLEATTQRINILRGNGLAAQQAEQTHCKRGHSLEDAHILSRNRRDCRKCRKMRNNSRSREYRRSHG